MYDPFTAHRIAIIRQQQLLDAAVGDRGGEPDDRIIRASTTQEILAHYEQRAALELFAYAHPLRLPRLLHPMRPMRALFAVLAGALRSVNTRQAKGTVYAAECCDLEGECAS